MHDHEVMKAGGATPFYAAPAVRQRLIEFCGAEHLEQATAVYLTHSDGCAYDPRELRPPVELDWFLERHLDIARSLADTESLLLHLDLEYVNFDAPAAAFTDPLRAFDLQEPVVREIEALLLGWGIRPLHLVTGQGHHFVWRIRRSCDLARRITALNPAPELVPRCLEHLPPLLTGHLDANAQEGFAGLALLAEYLAQEIKQRAAPNCEVPVEVTAVHVGACLSRQREMISIDISEYGDPLHTRMIRMPFTAYLKPSARKCLQDSGTGHPGLRAIPLHEMDCHQALEVRQSDAAVAELARRACVRIPLQEEGTLHLLEHYLASRLRRFHEYYYSTCHDPHHLWPHTYGRTPLERLPGCVRRLLEQPNDLLLKPAGMQVVTRCLLADGWHPRHIAGLIRSKFENPVYGWGVNWGDYEAGTRADFYTRLFAGLLATGVDRLVDFNCTSTLEKGFCFAVEGRACELETRRSRLLNLLPP
jgi:hypothetical protein